MKLPLSVLDKGLIPLVVYIPANFNYRNGKKLRNAIIIIIWHSLTKEQKENYKYVK